MSVLENKHILIVGDETSQIHNIEELVKAEGMQVHVSNCDMVSFDKIEHNHVNIVLLNHLHDGQACVSMLSALRKQRVHRVLPIIALVENTPVKIEEALSMGAADYITSDEPLESVIQKMKVMLGEPDNFAHVDWINLNDSTTVETPHEGSRVYVVEDDPLLSNLLALRLDKTGFTYAVDKGVDDVLKNIREFAPDVLVLDLMLPQQSGFEILESIRSDEGLHSLPVIVFSNRDSQEDRARAMELSVSGYYIKAMTDLSVLMNKINEVMAN